MSSASAALVARARATEGAPEISQDFPSVCVCGYVSLLGLLFVRCLALLL